MRFKLILLFTSLLIWGQAQIINAYADVTAISGQTISVASVDEAGDTFEVGEAVILMQMQSDCIGSNTTNVATFGDLGSIGSAGVYEIRYISSLTESAGLPVTLVLNSALSNTYSIGAASRVQVISFPLFGSPNFTTAGNYVAKAWDGTTGGLLAFQVNGTLTLANNLSANGCGFRGGSASANFYSGGTGCTTTEYIRTSNHTRAGRKGEGIYRTTNINFLHARGKLLNGGGGGSERINCGGGGGGNFTTGGTGGIGWSCTPPGPGGGGLGGLSLSAQISAFRIFMGGGGGGGQQNDSQGTAGGNGGGIVLIKASAIITSGACAGRSISANGNSVTGLTNDGQGGGGAGGSIVLEVGSWSIAAGCQLTVSANGGNGGTANTSTHAGGGGGGQGVVIYSSAQPTSNLSTLTNNGTPGCNNNSNPCTNLAGAPSGSNGNGVFSGLNNPLPVELSTFYLQRKNASVQLHWETSSEKSNLYFEVQRSANTEDWQTLTRIEGANTSSIIRQYEYLDKDAPNDLTYYRLKQMDKDGSFQYSTILFADGTETDGIHVSIFPNPVEEELTLKISSEAMIRISQLEIYNSKGQRVYEHPKSALNDVFQEKEVNLVQNLEPGLYSCLIVLGEKVFSLKFFVLN
ncbi:MAG: T9SS type A sorting domain-containing protein [Bacteroidia bacterium]|jgi:hypothetical protein|nr:T9SS type A sorting domain-containing protein [Bacteroidia bacterium]